MNFVLKANRWFLIPYSIFLIVSIFFILMYSKADIHIFLNSLNNPVSDSFFKYITNLGDGLFIPFFVVIMLSIRYRYAFLLLLVYAISGLFTQLLKRAFFAEIVRPTKYLDGIVQLHLVPGIDQLCCQSFPSGHATTAFGVMICFAMTFQHNFLKLCCFILAACIAYSRVYLSQHFLVDIVAGSIIGVLTGLFLYQYVQTLKWKWLDKHIFINHSR
jgi:membrane-associated phospholipid phosphatase